MRQRAPTIHGCTEQLRLPILHSTHCAILHPCWFTFTWYQPRNGWRRGVVNGDGVPAGVIAAAGGTRGVALRVAFAVSIHGAWAVQRGAALSAAALRRREPTAGGPLRTCATSHLPLQLAAPRRPSAEGAPWCSRSPGRCGPFGRVPLGIQDFCMKQSNRCRKNKNKNKFGPVSWRRGCPLCWKRAPLCSKPDQTLKRGEMKWSWHDHMPHADISVCVIHIGVYA